MKFPDPTERIIKLAAEEHYCPHCKVKLSCVNTPPFHVGDGLGWGTDVFFVCLNDECSLFVNSWEQFEEQYGHSASCRYMLLPGETKGEAMMVGSKIAFTGLEVDVESLMKQSTRHLKEKEAREQLACCIDEKNLEPALHLILDEDANIEGRKQACQCLVELSDLSCIDPIRNHKFKNTDIGQLVNLAISKILENKLSKECPHCAEIIKAKAKLCKHCKSDV